jgi:hypothetical protein
MKSTKSFCREVSDVSFQDFLEKYPLPALVFCIREVATDEELTKSSLSLVATARIKVQSTIFPNEPVPQFLAWLEKSDRNYFENLVIVGRSAMNDICLPVSTVSKIHAFFSFIGDEWL